MADSCEAFKDQAREIFYLARVPWRKNPERFVECMKILEEKNKQLETAHAKGQCSLEERNQLWAQQCRDLKDHLEVFKLEGAINL